MKMHRIAGFVVLVGLVVAIVPGRDALAAGVNGLKVTNVNNAVNATATVSGTYSLAMGVTMTKVNVFAMPTNGGRFGGTVIGTVNPNNGQWSGTITGLYNANYSFWAIGTFSDDTQQSSAFVASDISSVDGNGNPINMDPKWASLGWAVGSPAGGAKKITGQGTWSQSTDGNNTKFNPDNADAMNVYLFDGGPYDITKQKSMVTIDQPAAGQWQAADIGNLQANTKYQVVVVANASDTKTYCPPLKNATPTN